MKGNLVMRALRDASIKWKLTLIIMCASTVALLLISAAFVTYEIITFRESMAGDISTLAEMTGLRSTAALTFDRKKDTEEILGALSVKPHIVAACIYNKDGKVYAQYPKNIPADSLPAAPGDPGPHFDKDSLGFFHPIKLDGETIGTLYLKSDLLELHDRLIKYGRIIALFMLASSFVTFLLSSLLRRVITEPISQLAEAARAVSTQRNYSVRAVRRSRDELGQFTDVFNEMLAQIQERDAALQQANDKLEKRVEERTRDLQLEIGERRRAQEGLQQQLARISLLNRITHAISERQDLPSILQVMLRQLEEHLEVELGGVFLLDARGAALTMAALQEKTPRLTPESGWRRGAAISLEEAGLTACKRGEMAHVPDTSRAEAGYIQKLAAAGMNCAVAVPLMVEGKLFGILMVARTERDSFSSDDCEFLRMLSGHVALAAHQAQLHTELEAAYNDLRQSQQAVMQQDRLRALGQMASGIAHDINNALSPVVGFAGLLLEYEPDLSQSARKNLTYIKTAGEDVAHIVARLREFYRQREGREPLFPLKLNELAEQVMDMTRPRWRDIPQGKGIMVEMETKLAADLPDVLGIGSEVREALTNLVLNAVDAMPKGGKLSISTSIGRLGPGGKGDSAATHAILQVSDTGTGMNEATLKHCLEPFYSTKGKRGTGMGLAMVYGVMERHEGKIEIESKPGKGTTVRLIFPVRSQPSTGDTDEKPTAPTRPLRILCIDDEPLLRELVQDILERDGHQVQAADSGESGLDAFQSAADRGRPFEVVITDLGMPHLDGREVAKALKNESPGTPVILLTGWGAFMKGDGEFPAEVDGILSKPPRSNELREMLGRLTRKKGRRA